MKKNPKQFDRAVADIAVKGYLYTKNDVIFEEKSIENVGKGFESSKKIQF